MGKTDEKCPQCKTGDIWVWEYLDGREMKYCLECGWNDKPEENKLDENTQPE